MRATTQVGFRGFFPSSVGGTNTTVIRFSDREPTVWSIAPLKRRSV